MLMRVWKEKIMLVHHMNNLEDLTLAKTMLDEQVTNAWPGLASEVSDMCKAMLIEDAKEINTSTKEYAKKVKEACQARDETLMKKEMERMKESKMEIMIKSNCKIKDYMKLGKLHEVQKTWEARAYMLKVAGNLPGHKKYARTEWRCQACPLMVREDQDHLSCCTGYTDLLEHLDLGLDIEMVDFYKRVMTRREENKWD